MINKKVPMRTCIITKEIIPKKEMLRIVKTKDNKVLFDPTGKANGRGFYLKKDLEVIKKAQQNKILEKKLELEVEDIVYEELINNI